MLYVNKEFVNHYENQLTFFLSIYYNQVQKCTEGRQSTLEAFLTSNLAEQIRGLHLPRYGELPALELYMDQVISVIDGALHPLYPEEDAHILTSSMVNNYVKQKIVPPPVKKRYTRNHLAYFIVMALLKQVFSIAQISTLIRRQIQCASVETAYDRLCDELELTLCGVFSTRQLTPPPMAEATASSELLRSAVLSLVNKIYVEKYLEFSAQASVQRATDTPE